MLFVLRDESAQPEQPARRASVAALTDVGPRQVNEDRMFTAMSDDGAWVIAVADGLGGHARGDEAAQAAVEGLPERIGSESDMANAFAEADERVLTLSAAARRRSLRVSLTRIPMSTLCMAAWTPGGGLLIGWMGDTLPFVVSSGPGGFEGHCVGRPHRDPYGSISTCLGMPPEYDWSGESAHAEIIADFDESEIPDAVIIASDGVWEPLAIDYGSAEWLWDGSPAGIGSACDPEAGNASEIARSVLARAHSLGLNDNATVAVAHWGAGVTITVDHDGTA